MATMKAIETAAAASAVMMAASNGDAAKTPYKSAKPRLLARTWSESCDDVDVPGSPKTPRTSTTPGERKPAKKSKKLIRCDTVWRLLIKKNAGVKELII